MDIRQISVDEILPFLDRQSRKDEFVRLKDSIARNGVLVPIQLTKLKKAKKKKGFTYRYQLVWGHRRLRAAKETGYKKVPAVIVPIDDKERVKRFFIENEARKQLTAYETAQLMESDRGKLTIPEIAKKYSMTETTVRSALRTIENASPALIKHLNSGNFSLEDAKYVAMLSTHREQTLVVNRAIGKGLRGRLLKQEVRSIRDIENISSRSIQTKSKALARELRKLALDKINVESRYTDSVVVLINVLSDESYREMLKKAKIDFSAFWDD